VAHPVPAADFAVLSGRARQGDRALVVRPVERGKLDGSFGLPKSASASSGSSAASSSSLGCSGKSRYGQKRSMGR
jgi:hypothetical protein